MSMNQLWLPNDMRSLEPYAILAQDRSWLANLISHPAHPGYPGWVGNQPTCFIGHALTGSFCPLRSMQHLYARCGSALDLALCSLLRRRRSSGSWLLLLRSGEVMIWSCERGFYLICDDFIFDVFIRSILPVIIRPLIICDIHRPQIQRHLIQGLSVHLVDRPADRTMWWFNSPFYPRRWGEKRCSACSSVVVLVITCTFGTLIDWFIYLFIYMWYIYIYDSIYHDVVCTVCGTCSNNPSSKMVPTSSCWFFMLTDRTTSSCEPERRSRRMKKSPCPTSERSIGRILMRAWLGVSENRLNP